MTGVGGVASTACYMFGDACGGVMAGLRWDATSDLPGQQRMIVWDRDLREPLGNILDILNFGAGRTNPDQMNRPTGAGQGTRSGTTAIPRAVSRIRNCTGETTGCCCGR